ncbi:Alpha/Beta hydrolase protein [Favolaschia claudopus]|uniref:Alpha/Beta hydrolase protein n=1 Tax=Favolaschia claudopus TaxID=2862362 RepID=A0AAW0A7Z0_9AGAR
MPFVDIHSSDDFVSIYYTTNSFSGNVGGFNPQKPTVCILHPTFLDSSWLYPQFSDPRLDSEFNLIAFDMRVCGKSECRSSGRHDSWVEAADLALCAQNLRLSSFHILAMESNAINCALRFTALFPEMCLSLALCNVPAPTEDIWVYTAYDELIQTWCFAEDLESYEHVAMESVKLTFGSNISSELRDDLIAYWEMTMHPGKRCRILEQANVAINRSPIPSEACSNITQPVLIIQGDAKEACSREYAEKMAQDLKGIIYSVKGGGGYLSIIEGTASILNQVYVKFVTRLPHARSDPAASSISVEERMQEALVKLEQLTGDANLRLRDPLSPLSFCCLSKEIIDQQAEQLELFRKGQTLAFVPLAPTGRPIRRYSERPRDD